MGNDIGPWEYVLDYQTGEMTPVATSVGPWIRFFAFMPVDTISGDRVWFRYVYFRDSIFPGIPKVRYVDETHRTIRTEWNPYTVREYATDFDLLKEQHGT